MATTKLMPSRPERKGSSTSRWATGAYKATPILVSEEAFLQMLRLEQRRTERSGRAFILVLISGEDLQANCNTDRTDNVVTAIGSCIRETDVFGWYKPHTTLGIALTEINDPSKETVEAIVRKISSALQRSLSAEIYCRLSMVVRIYPNDANDKIFYPEESKRSGPSKLHHGLKRTIDILGSLTALILLSPLLTLIAMLIKCTSKGPILFCKKRVGQYGREFCFYKFRTMAADNDPHIHREYVSRLIAGGVEAEQNGGQYKLANDPRVTPLGRFLRRTSLDELPQFFNVLFNDMSLVGPRPPLPYEFERYRVWHRRRVLEQKPGITGLWQIEGRSRTTFDEMVRMDIRYAKAESSLLDLNIMLQTPAAMLSGRGAC
ncbi:sugar transferase [Acidicapsa ligni]|uniref:sugar transferase n=1 Tax=Acidicapsa ligni TaxID=542300 RepID=UPI0021DFFFF3|nr:sugar transferase [Acidicapsa ligni]